MDLEDEEGTFTEEDMRQAVELARKKPPCPICASHGAKAWHEGMPCPYGTMMQ